MNVFEELIDELKDEDLLEETVFSLKRSSEPVRQPHSSALNSEPAAEATGFALDHSEDDDFAAEPTDKREAHRRRAMDEVSSLQMVEHVLTGIEREHMKMSPQAFDDLEVKKSLHKYLQVGAAVDSEEHSQAESQLYVETEKWFSALAKRDNNISVANVRRFCENSRPVLSSQALMALGRFYRNSPFNEAVRGKFDFVMTRLFSREIGDEKRKLLFGRFEMLGHIKTLYSNWASLALVAAGDEESNPSIAAAVAGFEEFVRESEACGTFDSLIESDFFNRVRLFKESSAELFYEPGVLAAAMECNVRLGNRFVELIQKERTESGDVSVEEKYGYTYDTIISGAASKTLLLIDLLREGDEAAGKAQESDKIEVRKSEPKIYEFERAPVDEGRGMFAVNKWLLLVTVLVLALSGGVYFWSENAASVDTGIEVAPSVDLAGSELAQHIREASSSNGTLYGVMQPTWDALPEDDQKQFLSKTAEFARAKGMKKVNLLNNRGRTVAYVYGDKMEVLGPQ